MTIQSIDTNIFNNSQEIYRQSLESQIKAWKTQEATLTIQHSVHKTLGNTEQVELIANELIKCATALEHLKTKVVEFNKKFSNKNEQ